MNGGELEIDIPNVVEGGGMAHLLALLAGQAGMRAPSLPVLVGVTVRAVVVVRAV